MHFYIGYAPWGCPGLLNLCIFIVGVPWIGESVHIYAGYAPWGCPGLLNLCIFTMVMLLGGALGCEIYAFLCWLRSLGVPWVVKSMHFYSGYAPWGCPGLLNLCVFTLVTLLGGALAR